MRGHRGVGGVGLASQRVRARKHNGESHGQHQHPPNAMPCGAAAGVPVVAPSRKLTSGCKRVAVCG